MSALLMCACHKNTPSANLVSRMEFDSPVYGMFVDEQVEVSLKCYPENASNLDQLAISNSNPAVADFQNGRLTAKASGTSVLTATCGNVSAKATVRVYSGWFTKGGKKYGVDSASGYYFLESEPSPQSLQITLTHTLDNGQEEHFWAMLEYTNLGKTLDFTQNVDESQVAVYLNNNEDGYCIYGDEDGKPVLRTADWSDPGDVSLLRGILKVTDQTNDRFNVEADFELSNGYVFGAQWEGSVSMQTE